MAELTLAGEDYILDLLTQSSGAYQTYYIALGVGAKPSRFITGEDFEEPNFNDYQRAEFLNVSGNWTERASRTSNAQDILFPIATSEWGTVKHWAIATEPVGGDLLWVGSFLFPIKVDIAEQVRIPAGQLALVSTNVSVMVPL